MGCKQIFTGWMLLSCCSLLMPRTCLSSFLVTPFQSPGRVENLNDSNLPLSTIQDVSGRNFINGMHQSMQSLHDLVAPRFNREVAIGTPGSKDCLQALETLSSMPPQQINRLDEVGEERIMDYLPRFLSSSIVVKISRQLALLRTRDIVSTSRFNLMKNRLKSVSKSIYSSSGNRLDDSANQMRQELLDLVQPIVNGYLVKYMKELTNCATLSVSDMFIQIQQGKHATIDTKINNPSESPSSVSSRLVAVVCLDEVFDNPLESSNHIFLSPGDAIVQTWDVFQDSCLEHDSRGTMLVVEFTTLEQSFMHQCSVGHNPPLIDNSDTQLLTVQPNRQLYLSSHLRSCDCCITNQQKDALESWIHNWFLLQAQRGSTFAMTQLGTICESGQLSYVNELRARELLLELRPRIFLPAALRRLDPLTSESMARRFWLEAAVRGNTEAQKKLAKQLVTDAFRIENEMHSDQTRLLAAVLFGIAAQQEQRHIMDGAKQVSYHSSALQALQRMVHVDVASHLVDHMDDIDQLAVIKVAQASCNFDI